MGVANIFIKTYKECGVGTKNNNASNIERSLEDLKNLSI